MSYNLVTSFMLWINIGKLSKAILFVYMFPSLETFYMSWMNLYALNFVSILEVLLQSLFT